MMNNRGTLLLLLSAAMALGACARNPRPDFLATATVETAPVSSADDAADDPAIWVHPTDPALSMIVATNKDAGLVGYNLDGSQLFDLRVGRVNNVDLRTNVLLGGRPVDLVVAENRDNNTLMAWRVDVPTRALVEVTGAAPIQPGTNVYGLGLFRSPRDGALYAFTGSKEGVVKQVLLTDDGTGRIAGRVVRTLTFAGALEGIVGDDENGVVYISEEPKGIWKVDGEPTGEVIGLVTEIGPAGPATRPDMEGLALYKTGPKSGYLVASAQGNHQYLVFDREGENAFVARFAIGNAGGDGPDAVQETDGLDVTSAPLGPAFPQGLLVVQDGHNPGANQNFKLVPWEHVATGATPPLAIVTTHPAR